MGHAHFARKLALMLAMALLAALPLPAASAESFPAIVTASKMTVYSDAGCTHAIGTLAKNRVVTVDAYKGGVAKISLNGNSGFAKVAQMRALSDAATPVVSSVKTKVYQSANVKSAAMSIPKGLEMNLLAVNGAWAMVERNGTIGYMNREHLAEPGGSASEERKVEPFAAKVTADRMTVYAKASTKAKALGALAKDVRVTVNDYRDGWAYIEYKGNKGYAKVADMARLSASEQKEESKPAEDYLHSGKYSAEQIIGMFLDRELKLNTAAICGILANVDRESGFRVTAQSSDGGYGIVQWTGSRNTRLKNWCADNGFDPADLEGQLRFLKYELEGTYSATLSYLRGVENSAEGAYDAAYYFCYYFENPASRSRRSVERGTLARDRFWVKYAA